MRQARIKRVTPDSGPAAISSQHPQKKQSVSPISFARAL
jgi:hypothetical protein